MKHDSACTTPHRAARGKRVEVLIAGQPTIG